MGEATYVDESIRPNFFTKGQTMEEMYDSEPDKCVPQGRVMLSERETNRRRARTIGHERRLQLLRMAERIAAEVQENTKVHERCLLRSMIENLLPDE